MTTFIALYRGQTLNDARLIALSSDPTIISDFTTRLISEPLREDDPALRELTKGRRRALKVVQQENQPY
jgi:hypothetical protein